MNSPREQGDFVVTAMIEGLYSGRDDEMSVQESMDKYSHPKTSDVAESQNEPIVGDVSLAPSSDAFITVKDTVEPKLSFDFDATLTYNGYAPSSCTLVRTLSDEDLCKLI